MEEQTINTTHRHDVYCRAEAKDGRVCSLYSPHMGGHKPKHGLESDRWNDGE